MSNVNYLAPVAPIPWLYQTLWQSQDQGGFGYEVTVWKATNCPCGNSPQSPGNINCAACGGLGILYPEKPLKVMALVSNIDQNLDLVQYGLMEYGDLVLSPMPGSIHLDDFDLVILPWSIGTPTYSQTLMRSTTGDTDTADYRMMNVSGAWTVDPVTGTTTKYVPGQDFTYQGRTITWVGNQPQLGQLYSIRYDAQFEWVAFNPPTPRVAFGQDLGQRAILRKRHIMLPNVPSLLED